MFTTRIGLLNAGPQAGRFEDITAWLRDLRDATLDEFLAGEGALVKLARDMSMEREG